MEGGVNTQFYVCACQFVDFISYAMGNALRSEDSGPGSTRQIAGREEGRKRSLEKDSMSEEEVEELAPRRKKIVTTSTYIYETLFKKGVNSDVTITALG